MKFRYYIERTAQGWAISENGKVVTVRKDWSEAVLMGDVLISAVKAAGGSATLRIDGDQPSQSPQAGDS